MVPVDSSAIAEIGYLGRERTLLVRFRSGEGYAYFAVPPETHAAFLAAPSKGAFFRARIDPVFSFLRLNA